MVSPADRRRKARAASILDFKPRLGNRCRFLPGNVLGSAVILDLRGSIWESLQGLPGNALVTAAILDFKPRLGNRCMVLRGNDLQRAVILDFKPRLENRCCAITAVAKNGPPAAPSLRQVKMARLQNDRGGRRRGQDATKAA